MVINKYTFDTRSSLTVSTFEMNADSRLIAAKTTARGYPALYMTFDATKPLVRRSFSFVKTHEEVPENFDVITTVFAPDATFFIGEVFACPECPLALLS